MKASLLVLLLLLFVGDATEKQQAHPTKDTEKAQQAPAPATMPKGQPAPETQDDSPESKTSRWDDGFGPSTWSNWAVVVVGALGVFFAICTLRAIEKQARIMTRQTEAAEVAANAAKDSAQAARDNAAAANEGAEASKANATAAEAAAIAAKQGVDLTVSKERARISVQPMALNLNFKPADFEWGAAILRVDFEFSSYGLTLALVKKSVATVQITESAEPPPRQRYDLPIRLPRVFQPNTLAKENQHCFQTLTPEIVEAINQRKQFVHCWGSVKYADLFGIERETRFRYFWHISETPDITAGKGFLSFWLQCGAPEENQET